jgi:hypothetical protein
MIKPKKAEHSKIATQRARIPSECLTMLKHSQVLDFMILVNSFGSAMLFPHFLQVSAFTGKYVGMNALTLGSETSRSTRIFSTSNLLQCPQPTVSLEKNGKNQRY